MTLNLKEWKPVVGYEGCYQVSSEGDVMRLIGGMGASPGKLLRPSRKPNGYLKVCLSVNCVPKTIHLHKIVAEAFLGARPPGHDINHKDADKSNNRRENLEYTTRIYNLKHAAGLGRGHSFKLTDEAVQEIRAASLTNTRADLGRKFGVSASSISRVALRQSRLEVESI